MKITNFTIKNFKSFKAANNNLTSIAAINYIYGENNSGKSNILKFLKLIFSIKGEDNTVAVEGLGNLSAPSSEKNFFSGYIFNEPYIYHQNLRKENIEFEFRILLTSEEIDKSGYSFMAELEAGGFLAGADREGTQMIIQGLIKNIDDRSVSEISLINVKLNGKKIYDNSGDEVEYFGKSVQGTGIEGNRFAFTSLISYLNDTVLYIDNERFFKKETYTFSNADALDAENFKNWLYNFSSDEFRHKEYNFFMEFIKKYKISTLPILSNFDLTFSIDEDKNIEIFLSNGDERFPIDSFGTGVTQILFILSKIYLTRAKVILIEEIELNLSPNTQHELLNVFRQLITDGKIQQIFFTSHSNYFDFRNDMGLYLTTIDGDGVSSVESHQGNPKTLFRGS